MSRYSIFVFVFMCYQMFFLQAGNWGSSNLSKEETVATKADKKVITVNHKGQIMGYNNGERMIAYDDFSVHNCVAVPDEKIAKGVDYFKDKIEIKRDAAVNAIGAGLARAARNGRSIFS